MARDEAERIDSVVQGRTNGSSRLDELSAIHTDEAANQQDQSVTRRGTKPGTKRGPYKRRGNFASEAPEPVATTTLFTADFVGPVVRLPFVFASAKYKSDIFLLDPNEEKALADTGSACLNAWAPQMDPRLAATVAFATALLVIAGQKMLLHVASTRKQKSIEAEKLAAATDAA